MNTTKKLMTLLLALILPTSAFALCPYSYTNYEFAVDGIYYKIVDNEACVTFQEYREGMHLSDYHGDVVIPATVTYQDVTYPVTTIDYYAFNYCQGLTSITIPESIKWIGGSAFYLCTGLTRVTITDIEAWCRCIMGGAGSNPLLYAQHLYLNDTEVTDLTIPDGITAIGNYAFLGCVGLTSVTIPNSVTSIGDNAFEDCTGLTSLSIPNSVTEIGQVAFEGCTSLTSVTLGNAVTAIGSSAFAQCTALSGIVIPDAVTSIGVGAFSGCTSLTSATLGKSIASIGAGTFRNCASLTRIDIPDSVTEIGNIAFSGCSALSSVTIGSSVTTIGKDAFQNAPAIGLITCKATAPPLWTDLSMFTANVYNHAELHVPLDTETAYKTSQYWGQFLRIIADVTIETPGDEDGYEYVPFVREGVKWTYSIQDYHYEEDYQTNPARGNNKVYRTLEIKGDTVINGKTYKAVHMCTDDVYSEPKDVVPVYLREENKKVYGIVPVSIFFDDAIICLTPYGFAPDDEILAGEEFLLYDFQDPVTYWENLINDDWFNTQLQLDTVEVGGHYAKRLFDSRQEGDYFQVIEGIGAMGMNSYPLAFFMPVTTGVHTTAYYSLEKVVENGEVIYPQNYVEDRYQPVIREGVKWVNVHVVINDGDTTKNYYTYEFKGNYPELDSYNRGFKAVYSKDSDANGTSISDERLVAGLREDEACILSFRNEPLGWMTNFINFYTYQGNDDVRLLHENLEGMWDIDYYINNQAYPHMNLLNTDNFVEADPIEIDGVLCSRIAYIGEQGDTLAYLVEGIGFDSRDFGDLLTPLTRYPEADCGECYQEYCGLSHVIKDGKIIYKGMCYHPIEIPGDVNGDGEITVADANSVIDVVIMGGNASHPRIPIDNDGNYIGDVNGDGEVTIADVNAIIDMILNNH